MDIFNDNLAITNGIPLGFGTGIALEENAIDRHGKITEYEKEQMLAKQNRVLDEDEKERFMQRLEDGTY